MAAVERIVHIDMSKHTREQAEKMIKSATLAVERDAILYAPYDIGNLRGSITHQVSGLRGTVGTPVEYAPHVEYGTVHMQRQQYLRPALDGVAKQIERLWGG